MSKQHTGSSQNLRREIFPQVPPRDVDAVSESGMSGNPDIKKDPRYFNPSARSSSPPPRYSDAGSLKNRVGPQQIPKIAAPTSQDPGDALSRFSTRFDMIPPAQAGAQTFIAEDIHMYHGCRPAHHPNVYPSAPPMATWQPVLQPPPPPPGPPLLVPPPRLAYKSSAYSLRETLATEFLDLIKPDATCIHGIRHHKNHANCGWGCCWQRRCFGGP